MSTDNEDIEPLIAQRLRAIGEATDNNEYQMVKYDATFNALESLESPLAQGQGSEGSNTRRVY